MTRFVGAKDGLASERIYVLKTLPQGVIRGITDTLLHHDISGIARAGAIIAGFVVTVAGYLVGSLSGLRDSLKGAESNATIGMKF